VPIVTQAYGPHAVLAGGPLAELTHVCALVRPGERVRDLQVELVREGLAVGDRVITITEGSARAGFVRALEDLGVDADAAIRSGRMVTAAWDETYLIAGTFDPAAMIAIIRRWLAGDQSGTAVGRTRMISDMSWAVAAPPGSARLAEYESRVDDLLRRTPEIGVCIYDLDRHDAHTVAEILAHHPITLVGGALRPASGLRQPASSRGRILTAASELFSESGVRSTGVDAIIKSAGIAKATFYRQFPSKDDLIVAWLEDSRSRWFDLVRAHAEASTTRPTEVITFLFDAVAEWLDADGFRGCPYLNTAVELGDPAHPARPVIRRYYEGIEAYLTSLGEAAGLAAPAMLASELLALLAGSISLAVARRTSAFALSAREAAEQLLAVAERA
jgi:AcrR family transcriptional regulator